jgi:hypothetical protein
MVRQFMRGECRPLWVCAMFAGLFALGGCQQAVRAPGSAEADTDAAAAGNLPADPPCPDNLTAVLASGVTVRFMGAAASDPQTCVQTWNGREYRYYLGFWGNGRLEEGSPQQRQALAAVLSGPVGMTATVELHAPTQMALWRSATVTHEADTSLQVGSHKRSVVKLRVVRHDAPGGKEVAAETLYWLDRESGIPLREQTVTRLADGQTWHTTTWDVSALRWAGAGQGASGGVATQLE